MTEQSETPRTDAVLKMFRGDVDQLGESATVEQVLGMSGAHIERLIILARTLERELRAKEAEPLGMPPEPARYTGGWGINECEQLLNEHREYAATLRSSLRAALKEKGAESQAAPLDGGKYPKAPGDPKAHVALAERHLALTLKYEKLEMNYRLLLSQHPDAALRDAMTRADLAEAALSARAGGKGEG